MGKVVMGWLYAMIGVGNHTPMLYAIRRAPTTFLQGSRSSPQALGLLLSTELEKITSPSDTGDANSQRN